MKKSLIKVVSLAASASMALSCVPVLAAQETEYATREYVVSEFVQSVGRSNLTSNGYVFSTFKDSKNVSIEYADDLVKATSNGLLQGYMTNFLKYINITFESCGILLCIVAIIILLIGTKLEKATRNYFLSIFLCMTADFCCNITGLLTKGYSSPIGIFLVRAANFGEFFFSFLMSFLFTLYILHVLGGKNNPKLTVWYRVAFSLIIFSELMVIATQFTGWLYTIDENAMYKRGNFYWISSVVAIGMICMNIFVIIMNKNNLRKKEHTALISYCVIMVIASMASALMYGINWILFGFILTAVIMLVMITYDQVNRYIEKERENNEMQSKIMLSQIKPHFLYNSLTSIAWLCDKNPAEAKEAIITFSIYLRENMNSLNEKSLYPLQEN